jgi:transcriptional regulator with XRE-family HTH domain
MAALRRQKGLSQTELAEQLGTTQKTVDYYERRTINPTLDVIQKVADALEVSPVQLIGDNNGSMKISRKTGPTSKLQKVFEDVARLPRRQQEKIVEVVSALTTQYESRQ